MSMATLVAIAMFLGVVSYALLGGADFGSGFYDLTAGDAQRGARVRTLIDHSIGPLWEANHVWSIYILVIWWTGFPTAFAVAMTTLFIPMALALAGIVLRGATFAFRKYAATVSQGRLFGAVFAGSSLISPFFLGTVAGAIASGRVPAQGYGDRLDSWLNPTSLVGGCLAVASCVFLAGVFLTADASRSGDTSLAYSLRARTLAIGAVTGLIVFAGLYPVSHDAPTLAAGLRDHACPLLAIALVGGVPPLCWSTTPLRGGTIPGRRRGRIGDHRLGRRTVPMDARRHADHQRGRRRRRDPSGVVDRGRPGRRHRPAQPVISPVAHSD
jgi:cytochrome d ubiquinol oxidase subunit II